MYQSPFMFGWGLIISVIIIYWSWSGFLKLSIYNSLLLIAGMGFVFVVIGFLTNTDMDV